MNMFWEVHSIGVMYIVKASLLYQRDEEHDGLLTTPIIIKSGGDLNNHYREKYKKVEVQLVSHRGSA